MSWRMKLAFLIAGKELDAWRSKHNRIVAKMATSMTEGRIIKMLEPEVARHFELGLDASAHYLQQLIGQIKGEQK